MRFLIPFFTLSFILLFNTSCEEFNEVILNNTEILESIENDFGIIRNYEYNEKEQVSRLNIHSQSSGNISYYYTYEYSKDTTTIKFINNSNDVILQVEKIYNVDRNTVRSDFYGINGTNLIEYRLYRYNGNSCGYSEREIYNPDNTLIVRYTYAYYNVNCSEDIHYYNQNDSLISRIIIERDDKQPYFASTALDILKRGDLGNIIYYTYMDADSIIDNDRSYYVDYQYDNYYNENYPIVENKYYNNGSFEMRIFNYIDVQ